LKELLLTPSQLTIFNQVKKRFIPINKPHMTEVHKQKSSDDERLSHGYDMGLDKNLDRDKVEITKEQRILNALNKLAKAMDNLTNSN